MNNPETIPEIFTPEEQDENAEQKRELIELVASEEAILIVGAGSSARVGYVIWEDLLEKLENLADQCGCGFEANQQKRKEKPLEYAEDIKSHINKEMNGLGMYYDLLYELFQPKSPSHDEFHRLLVELPVRGILTTNYDTVLEGALLGKKRDAERTQTNVSPIDESPLIIGHDPPRLIHEFLLSRNNDPQVPQRIAHLHGMYRNSESIILSSNDYIKYYGLDIAQTSQPQRNEDKWTLHRKLLWAVLATRRAVFVGFSMDDPYLNKMSEIVSTDLWGWNKSIHFAIMDISPESAEDSKGKAERLKNKYGIDTVFYDNSDKSYRGLEWIISDIAKECGVDIQSTIIPEALSGNNDRSDGEQLITNELVDRLEELKQMSQRIARRIGDAD